MDSEWQEYATWMRTFRNDGKSKISLLQNLEFRTLEAEWEEKLCNEKPYGAFYYYRTFLPQSQGGRNILSSISKDPVYFSDLPLQIRKHAEELARADFPPDRLNLPLMRPHVTVREFLSSDVKPLLVVPALTCVTESTVSVVDTPMESEPPRTETKTQTVLVTPVAKPVPKAPTESSVALFPIPLGKTESGAQQKVEIRERLKASKLREAQPKPARMDASRTEDDVYERLEGHYRYQSLLSLVYTIAKRRHNLVKKDPETGDGYARKMGELMTEIMHSSLYRAGCREDRMVEYVGNLYEAYFEECDFDRPTLKEFMEHDWRETVRRGESPQAWMERPDPDFESHSAKKQLASLWYRAECLLSHKINPPSFVVNGKSNPNPVGRNVAPAPRNFIAPRQGPYDSPSKNRARANWLCGPTSQTLSA